MHKGEQLKVVLAFSAIYIIWGSTFYAVSIALKSFPPFLLSTLRMLVAGGALLVVCMIRKEPMPAKMDLLKNAGCGILMFVGGVVAVVWAQQFISSSLASIIITTPFWFVVLDKREWKFYFSTKWIPAGLITGLAGVVLLLGWKQGRPGSSDNATQIASILLMIAGSAMWVTGALFLKYKPTATSSYVSTCIQLLAAGIFCLVATLLRNEPQSLVWSSVRPEAIVALGYLSIVSSLITFMAFVWLIKIMPPAIVSTYSYVNPVVAVLLGWGLGNEYISSLQIVALAVILCGVFLVNVPKYKMAQ